MKKVFQIKNKRKKKLDRGYPRNFKEKLLSQMKLKERKEVRAPETKLKGRKDTIPALRGSAVAWGGAGGPGGRGRGAGSPNNFDKHV